MHTCALALAIYMCAIAQKTTELVGFAGIVASSFVLISHVLSVTVCVCSTWICHRVRRDNGWLLLCCATDVVVGRCRSLILFPTFIPSMTHVLVSVCSTCVCAYRTNADVRLAGQGDAQPLTDTPPTRDACVSRRHRNIDAAML